MLKVAIAGCGKIADEHAAAIQRIAGCEIVGVCDREPLMARQFSDRFRIARYFASLPELLDQVSPDVVHITTPPGTHYDLAKLCLDSACHIYVEKPFTLFEQEACALIELATSKGLRVTVGHDAQFGHATRRMRALVHGGYLGDRAVHLESYYGYELGESYARALLGDTGHWVRRLPGQLLQNVISHGIARISEFLTTDTPQIIAYGFTSPFLTNLGETEITDELRVIISEKEGTTAYFTFSSQMRPLIHQFRIYGSRNGLVLDPDQETLIRLRGTAFTSYAEKFIPPVNYAKQYLGNLATNVRTFLAMDFHMKAGMKYLIEAFYRSIREGTEVPIPYREILLTARIMDAIFAQLQTQSSHDPEQARAHAASAMSR